MSYLLATLLSVLMVTLCIAIHYEALNLLSKVTHRPERHRWTIILMMHGLLLAHVIEICIFGVGHYAATHWLNLGAVIPAQSMFELHGSLFDYLYYSAMVYTTVGFGDVVPQGELRMLTSTEAVSGLALITWSASFTFLQMQRLWR